ncbi:sensor histidine kinase [Actinoalloteichus caeruleus]|uniref:sensor histidine kinase n=2 Tax=Actinoalloteichus cyanogriseus TaxID=2893586 RepID=UPI0009DF39F4|nr:histidine kinase [Actinoalloteichus caeruleus]
MSGPLRSLAAWARPPWRDPLIAVALFTFGAVLYELQDPTALPGVVDQPQQWARLLVLGVCCSGTLLRARRPPLALAIGLAGAGVDFVLGFSAPVLFVLADLMFAAVHYGSRRLARAMVALVPVALVGSLVVTVATTGLLALAFLTAVQVAAVVLIPVWWGMNVRQHRDAAAAERERAEQAARIAELDRRAVIANERARMARDLHDVVAGHLSAIAIQSEAVLSMAGGGDQATVRTVLGSIRENSVRSLTEMRAMIDMLRGDEEGVREVAAPPRLAEVDGLVDSARASGLRVAVRNALGAAVGEGAPGPPAGPPAAVELAAYRIIQEALTNAVRHAPGSRVDLVLERTVDGVLVTVTNTLPDRLPPSGGTGHGLTGMRERARATGGTVTAGVVDGRWRVRAALPVRGDDR